MILDVHGVGYEIFVPLGAALPDAVTLHIHTHVREDALQLYGFSTSEDRAAFRVLLGVNSVGPKLALALLSHLDATALRDAVAREDREAFRGIPGVGKKIVERLVLELKDKLTFIATSSNVRPATPRASTTPTGPFSAVVSVLVGMGFRREEAERAVATLDEEQVESPTADLVKAALAALA